MLPGLIYWAIYIVPAALLALVTGGLCGRFMRRISVKRGLLAGFLAAMPSAAVIAVYMHWHTPTWPPLVIEIAPLITVAAIASLCWLWNRKAGESAAAGVPPWRSSRQDRESTASYTQANPAIRKLSVS